MSHVLVVKEAVGDLRRGDTVTDPDKVDAFLGSHPGHFVRRPAHSHELAEIEAHLKAKAEAKAEAAKSKTSKAKE